MDVDKADMISDSDNSGEKHDLHVYEDMEARNIQIDHSYLRGK